MEKACLLPRGAGNYIFKCTNSILKNLGQNHLWQRQLKNVAATTIAGSYNLRKMQSLERRAYFGFPVSVCLIPGSETRIGKAAYLAAIATVFGHPGRRFGQVVEALILVLAGTALGVAWSVLGLYLGSLAKKENPPATYAIRGIFLVIALIFHGFLRSRTPRLFVFVLLFILICLITLTTTAQQVTPLTATQSFYPILIAAGTILLVNLFVLPEFSASFLGETTIETLHDAADVLQNAGHYFVTTSGSGAVHGEESNIHDTSSSTKKTFQKGTAMDYSSEGQKSPLGDSSRTERNDTFSDLTKAKAKIRAKLASCKAAQSECNFEIAFGALPPRKLKSISTSSMKKLVANVIAIIGACESKFALFGETDDREYLEGVLPSNNLSSHQIQGHFASNTLQIGPVPTTVEPKHSLDRGSNSFEATLDPEHKKTQIDLIKPKREIEFGDVRLLRYLLERIARPYAKFSKVISRAVDCVTVCIACTYNVGRLPSGVRAPKGLAIEEVDVLANELGEALITFDLECTAALEGVVEKQEERGEQPDVMPREEIFLIASFLLNLRQAATHIRDMIKHSRILVQQYQQRHGRRRLYAPRIKWRKWLYSGGEEDESLPSKGRKENRKGEEDERADDEGDDDLVNSEEDLLKANKRIDLESGSSQRHVPGKVAARVKNPATDCAEGDRIDESLQSFSLKLRGQLADGLEWVQSSDDVLYAFKLTFAVFLVIWPALVARWNTWYSLDRGSKFISPRLPPVLAPFRLLLSPLKYCGIVIWVTVLPYSLLCLLLSVHATYLILFIVWAALQLVFITEVSIGTSVMTFILRGIGTTLGCLWGWAALEARGANRIVVAAMICVGLIPCTYIQLGTNYPKAGMVCIVSMCVVALSTEIQTVPGKLHIAKSCSLLTWTKGTQLRIFLSVGLLLSLEVLWRLSLK